GSLPAHNGVCPSLGLDEPVPGFRHVCECGGQFIRIHVSYCEREHDPLVSAGAAGVGGLYDLAGLPVDLEAAPPLADGAEANAAEPCVLQLHPSGFVHAECEPGSAAIYTARSIFIAQDAVCYSQQVGLVPVQVPRLRASIAAFVSQRGGKVYHLTRG